MVFTNFSKKNIFFRNRLDEQSIIFIILQALHAYLIGFLEEWGWFQVFVHEGTNLSHTFFWDNGILIISLQMCPYIQEVEDMMEASPFFLICCGFFPKMEPCNGDGKAFLEFLFLFFLLSPVFLMFKILIPALDDDLVELIILLIMTIQ